MIYKDRALSPLAEKYREEVYLLRTAGYERPEVETRLDFNGPDYLREDVLDYLYEDLV